MCGFGVGWLGVVALPDERSEDAGADDFGGESHLVPREVYARLDRSVDESLLVCGGRCSPPEALSLEEPMSEHFWSFWSFPRWGNPKNPS